MTSSDPLLEPAEEFADFQSGSASATISHQKSDEEEAVFSYSPGNDSDEEFVYTRNSEEVASNAEQSTTVLPPDRDSIVRSLTSLIESPSQPGHSHPPSSAPSPSVVQTQPHASPAQLEALYAAASSGDLVLLKKLFWTAVERGELEAFALANDASSRTGFTPLHVAASRGFLDITQWLIEECGAMPDLEDREGETALHKAALHGHLPIIQYLLPHKAEVHARDADGWTALHNACSKGYLGVVRWLCESGGAANQEQDTKGVDISSKGGWTPLMNAASKGHLPVVLYLLKQGADPLIRNNWGETAYDVAAAVFEVWICEVLQKAEAERWRHTTVSYNPLAVHMTIPLVVYENQRLDTRLKTLAVSGGRPKFSASGLGKHGRRSPFELKMPPSDEQPGVSMIPSGRGDVQLPLKVAPFVVPHSPSGSRIIPEDSERSHFWLSDWALDITPPGVDAETGWQYAPNFGISDDAWSAEYPPQSKRLLSTSGAMMSGPTSSRNHSHGSSSFSGSSSPLPYDQSWVRRRRWVRVMRRRLDIPPLAFMQPDGAMYHLTTDGSLVPCANDEDIGPGDAEGQELGNMPPNPLSLAQDYVARARYLVGNQSYDIGGDGTVPSAIEARRAIAKLERATTELRQGILGDDDSERRTQAEVLLKTYSRDLERRRLSAGAQGLLVSQSDDDRASDYEDEEREFRYPGYSPAETTRASSVRSDSRPSGSRTPTDLTPHLAQAAEFRVPTHETPQKIVTVRLPPTPQLMYTRWERDGDVQVCNDCHRRFTFILRRHCRKCGRIFCDRCSSHRVVLDSSDIVQDPSFPDPFAVASPHRVCHSCFDQINISAPTRFQSSNTAIMERIVVDQGRLTAPGHLTRQNSSSQLSDLAECPVCGVSLADLGTPAYQESHVKSCLEGRTGSSVPQSAKYLIYKLPPESALIGIECVICLEEFAEGAAVARLSCLCSFHNACLASWLQRGRNCPVHAR